MEKIPKLAKRHMCTLSPHWTLNRTVNKSQKSLEKVTPFANSVQKITMIYNDDQ